MVVRRFIFDSKLGAVVELGQHTIKTDRPGDVYHDAEGHWRQKQDDASGLGLRNAALERADRRVFAHRKYGDEGRWAE